MFSSSLSYLILLFMWLSSYHLLSSLIIHEILKTSKLQNSDWHNLNISCSATHNNHIIKATSTLNSAESITLFSILNQFICMNFESEWFLMIFKNHSDLQSLSCTSHNQIISSQNDLRIADRLKFFLWLISIMKWLIISLINSKWLSICFSTFFRLATFLRRSSLFSKLVD